MERLNAMIYEIKRKEVRENQIACERTAATANPAFISLRTSITYESTSLYQLSP